MRDFDEVMHSLIAGLIGVVAGILFASLTLSAYGAAMGGMRWDELSNVATFWNGHLTALSILIIGAGLFIQARQLRAQLETERNQARRSSLEWLTLHLPMLASELCAYHFDGSTTPPSLTAYRGLQQFAAAVLSHPREFEEVEVWVDNPTLASYAQAAKAVKRIETDLGPSDSVLGASPYGVVYHHGVFDYAERIFQDRTQLLRRLQQVANDDTAVAGFAAMLDQGWKIEENTIQGIYYLRARRLDPIFRRIDLLRSNDANLPNACRAMVQEWATQYR